MIVVRLICKGKMYSNVLMASVRCLHFSMQEEEEDILEDTIAKCHLCTL